MSIPQNPLQFLITGCSSGLGLELARAVLAAGHKVIASSRNPPQTPEFVAEIEKAGGAWIGLDVSRDDVGEEIERVMEKYGQVDVLVNNAGYPQGGVLETIKIEDARKQMETNVYGPIRTIQAVLPSMRTRKSGVIVNISSAVYFKAWCTIPIYAASKWALEGMTEAFAMEVSPFSIRVVLFEPSDMRSNFVSPSRLDLPDLPDAYKGTVSDAVMKGFLDMHGRQRIDPVRAARGILEEILRPCRELPLLRIPLGRDALELMGEKVRGLEDVARALGDVGLGVDFPEGE